MSLLKLALSCNELSIHSSDFSICKYIKVTASNALSQSLITASILAKQIVLVLVTRRESEILSKEYASGRNTLGAQGTADNFWPGVNSALKRTEYEHKRDFRIARSTTLKQNEN